MQDGHHPRHDLRAQGGTWMLQRLIVQICQGKSLIFLRDAPIPEDHPCSLERVGVGFVKLSAVFVAPALAAKHEEAVSRAVIVKRESGMESEAPGCKRMSTERFRRLGMFSGSVGSASDDLAGFVEREDDRQSDRQPEGLGERLQHRVERRKLELACARDIESVTAEPDLGPILSSQHNGREQSQGNCREPGPL